MARRRRLSRPLPQPATQQAARQPTLMTEGPVSEYRVETLRHILREHECGEFVRSASLARHLERSADLAGALLQRLAGVESLPFELRAANASTNATGMQTRIQKRWSCAFPQGVQRSLLKSHWMLGFAVARVVAAYDPEADELVPSLEYWDPSLLWLQTHDGTWWALTAEGYVCIIDAGGRVAEGWAVELAGSQRDAHFEGAIRCLGEPYLGTQYAARDTRRRAERMGQGILEAKIPAAQSESKEAKSFTRAISRIGTTGVIVSPQYPQSASDIASQASFGIQLHFPPPEGMKGLLDLDAREVQRIRLRLLGQDTTSTDSKGGGFARSKTGDGIRWDIVAGDAKVLASFARQLLDAWSLFEGRPRALYPVPDYCTEEPEDEDAEADRRQKNGQALGALVTALPALRQLATEAQVEVDVPELLRRFGVPLKETEADVA